MKSVEFTRAAQKQLRKLPADSARRLEAKLARYAQTGEGDVTQMVGEPGFRLRDGDYRAVFVIEGDILKVARIGHRREIYR